MGLAAPPATEAIVEALPRAQQGVASATNDVARELDGAIGIALIGSALTSGYGRSIDGNSTIPLELAPVIRDCFAGPGGPGRVDTAPAGLAVADTSPDPFTIIDAVRNSVVDGFSQSMILAGGLLTIGTL